MKIYGIAPFLATTISFERESGLSQAQSCPGASRGSERLLRNRGCGRFIPACTGSAGAFVRELHQDGGRFHLPACTGAADANFLSSWTEAGEVLKLAHGSAMLLPDVHQSWRGHFLFERFPRGAFECLEGSDAVRLAAAGVEGALPTGAAAGWANSKRPISGPYFLASLA